MGVMEPGPDRASWNTEEIGDLGRCVPDVVMQHQHRALVGREPSEAALQLVSVGDAQELVGSAGAVARKNV